MVSGKNKFRLVMSMNNSFSDATSALGVSLCTLLFKTNKYAMPVIVVEELGVVSVPGKLYYR